MLIILIIIILVFLLTFIFASFSAAPWVWIRKHDIKRVIKFVKPCDKFYDLGCGDARLLSAAAKKGAKAIGFEISLLPYLISKFRPGIQVKYQNFWHANLSNADIIYFFLMPKALPKLKQKLEQELKPGTRVISYIFQIPGWKPIKIDNNKIYLYIIK